MSVRSKDAPNAKDKPGVAAIASSSAATTSTTSTATSTATTTSTVTTSASTTTTTATTTALDAATHHTDKPSATATAKAMRVGSKRKNTSNSKTTTSNNNATHSSSTTSSGGSSSSSSGSSTVTSASSTPSHNAASSPPQPSSGDAVDTHAPSNNATMTPLPPVPTSALSASVSPPRSPSTTTAAENAPPSAQVDVNQCVLCGAHENNNSHSYSNSTTTNNNTSDENDKDHETKTRTKMTTPTTPTLMVCRCCGCGFHAQCANLPQTPEEGEVFCRVECFSTFRRVNHDRETLSKTPLADFSRLAARVQSIVEDLPRRHLPAPSLPLASRGSREMELTSSQSYNHSQRQCQSRGIQQQRERDRGKRAPQPTAGSRSRSSSPFPPLAAPVVANGFSGRDGRHGDSDIIGSRRMAPSSLGQQQSTRHHPHIDLTQEDDDMDDEPLSRSRPPPRSAARLAAVDSSSPLDDPDRARGKRVKYPPPDDDMASRRALYTGRPRPPHVTQDTQSPVSIGGGGGAVGGNGMAPVFDHHHKPHPLQPHPPLRAAPATATATSGNRLPSMESDHHHSSRGGSSSARSSLSRPGSARTRESVRYSDRMTTEQDYEVHMASRTAPAPAPRSGPMSHGRRPPTDQFMDPDMGVDMDPDMGLEMELNSMDMDSGNATNRGRGYVPAPAASSGRAQHRASRHAHDTSSSAGAVAAAATPPPPPLLQPSVAPPKYNIPWLNPAAFPSGLRERFPCEHDNTNGVFRIDLSPVFADKATHLFQSEIDFFFRCFESADVSLVVKGLASELNQYIWAWPFILESCGNDSHFSFDHFQFRHTPGELLPELEYVGELRLSMAAYNAYLERCLSGSMAKDVIVLEDHVTKKPITLVAAENIIALNDLAIADHCAQLYNDLLKSFQWDVFAGGIHCVLQYLPHASRHKRFSSPRLHFNFPGARGRLRDPGNGTTDRAYQVLVGSLELVIFERLEPKDRDTFHRVLCSAGYDPKAKPMLLDAHLRVLRDAGFAWSTVLLSDGEFVHVNKGRLHFWRVVEPAVARGPVVNAPCVFLSWEWVYQGVSQRGISTECWFAMKNASLCTGGWAFDPRRAIVEAAKCGVAVVRTGQFLSSLATPSAPPVLLQLAFASSSSSLSSSAIDRDVIAQRQEQMVLFLESILPCMDAIVEEEFELGLVKDDSDDFRKIFDDESMWKVVDTALSARHPLRVSASQDRDYGCGICGLELTNIYKQCLGCTVHARRVRPNASYQIFRICLRCHAQPEHHHFKPRALHGFYDKLCSSEGHTGLLPATRRFQAERSYFKCRCAPYVRCTYCGGCESCCCLCHTLFQTRFRYTAPEHLDHLRTDVVDVIKWHKQQLQHLQQQEQHAIASGHHSYSMAMDER